MCCSTLTDLYNYRSYPFYVVCCGRDRMVVRCTTTYTISAYHYKGWEFESRSLLDTALCDTNCQWFATGQCFSPGTPISSTNKTDPPWYKENIVESDIEHHNPNPYYKWGLHLHKRLITCLSYYLPPVDHYYITICAGMFVDQGSSTFSLRMATTGACSAIHIMIKFTNLTNE